MGELDGLQAEINNDLLDAWIKVYGKAQTIYDGLPADEKLRIEEHGHEVESLVWVIVQMKPHVRALCWALVEQGRAASLSQDPRKVPDTDEHSFAQVASGGVEMVQEAERLAVVEAKLDLILDVLGVPEESRPGADGSPRAEQEPGQSFRSL